MLTGVVRKFWCFHAPDDDGGTGGGYDAGADSGSQDFGSLFEDDPGAAPAEGTPGQGQPPPAELQRIAEENRQLKARLEQQEQWRNDLGRVFSGGQTGAAQLNEQMITQMATQPAQFAQTVAQIATQQAVQQASEAARQEAVVQSFRQKYPQYLNYEEEIGIQVAQARAEAERTGKQLGYEELVQEGITRFEQKFQFIKNNQNAARQTMRLDVGSQPGLQTRQMGPEDRARKIMEMPMSDFEKFSANVDRSFYKY